MNKNLGGRNFKNTKIHDDFEKSGKDSELEEEEEEEEEEEARF